MLIEGAYSLNEVSGIDCEVAGELKLGSEDFVNGSFSILGTKWRLERERERERDMTD